MAFQKVSQWINQVKLIVNLVVSHSLSQEKMCLRFGEALHDHAHRVLIGNHFVTGAVEDGDWALDLIRNFQIVEPFLHEEVGKVAAKFPGDC